MGLCGCGLLASVSRKKVSSDRRGIAARLAETPKSTAVALGASLFLVIGKYYLLWEWGKRRLLQRCHWGTQMRHMAVVNEEHRAGHRLHILLPPKSTPVNYWFKTGVVDEDRGFMQGRAETKKGDQVVGSYQYSDGHVKVKVVYSADQHGYRILKEEKVTMKPFTGSEVTLKGPKEKPFSPKPLKKTPVALPSFKEVSGAGENQNQPSPFAPQGLQLGSFGLNLRTNHGSGGYSHQGLSISSGKSTKHRVNHDSSGLQDRKPPKTRNPLWQDDDAFNHSLEHQNEVRPKPVKIVYKSPNTPFKSAPGNKPKSRKPKIATEGLAIFFKDQYPSNGAVLFRPQEATNPVAAPKKRNPRHHRPLRL